MNLVPNTTVCWNATYTICYCTDNPILPHFWVVVFSLISLGELVHKIIKSHFFPRVHMGDVYVVFFF